MTRSFRAALLSGVALVAIAGTAFAQSQADPPARIGRLAYLEGAVSFHDAQQDSWEKATINRPITTGDSLWTEPSGHNEISIAATRVRMDGNSQLDVLALDDSQTKLQLSQGRLDVRAFDLQSGQPYQIVTPRGTVTLQQKGDYYIHAGSTDDPTLIGVREGAAQIQTPNGQVLAVRTGEVGEVIGDSNALRLETVRSAPPAQPTYWAQRDQQITYVQPQYLSDDVTGYQDMAYYGTWNADPEYGQVWYPNSTPAGWAPYTTGSWEYSQPYGWTWVDSQPWGFAPYHYGRWAQRNNRWAWVPPDRQQRAVYAPALVAFIGGTELGIAIGAQNRAPVGWFPLGPREAYVPPYTSDRTYYQRLNASARVPDQALNDRWQRAERREALRADDRNEQLMNRRFTTVVSAEDFARSRPVQQAAIKVSAEKLVAAPVAPVSAPPAPNRSIAAAAATPGQQPANQPNRPNEPNRAQVQGQTQGQQAAGSATVPTAQTRFANMEEIGRPQAQRGNAPGPKIAAHTNATTNTSGGATTNATVNGNSQLPALAPRVGSAPPKLQGERTPATTQPGQTPPLPQANRAEPNKAEPNKAEPQKPNEPARANEPARPAQTAPQTPQRPAEQRAEPPKPNEPARPAEMRATPAAPAQPQHQAAEPSRPPQAQPQHQEPARQPQAQAPAPQPPHQAEAPRPQPQPAPQHVAPPPQAQQAPAPQQRAPAPPPPPQAQQRAPAPAPQPQQHAAPPAPPQQAQAPHPAPPPQAAPAPHPAPATPAPAKKEDEKK